ncbi:DUF1829 domain-containing protein [Treponema sp. UBA6852]|uniref:DUF1829 domain-containing protein n=1 Tax=Treponema sp. UBA6852 TaxID=1947744 RepID=UPI000E9E4160|nr:DUF1829 domain-containing protein [Treponema sp. UBA6852]HAZ96916.1 hypothetical protein [Treponema sp.]
MKKTEIDALIDSYFKWLKENTSSKIINDTWSEITTPYLDRHNDCLQIYAKKEGDKIILSDDGYIIDDLESSGCHLDSPRRKEILNITLRGFGVLLDDNQLIVKTSAENFPQKKHDLIQAMLAVNDLFYLSKPQVQNLFFDDVVAWFDKNDIRYVQKVKFSGKTGFDNMFDFGIPKSKKYSERLVQTITNPSKENSMNLVFKWIDTKDERPTESVLFAMLNDSDKAIASQVNEAFSNYGINVVPWSEKEKFIEKLAS